MGALPVATNSVLRVLIAGGSYAGISAAVNLLDLCHGRSARLAPAKFPCEAASRGIPIKITIVDERDGYYHLIGSPLAFASRDYPAKAWARFCDIPALQHADIECVQGSLTHLNPDSMLASLKLHGSDEDSQHPYDYFIAATGLRRVYPVVPQSLTKKQYLLETSRHIDNTEGARHGVVVVGGGAVGIEMAAETKLCHPTVQVTLVHSRDQLLSAKPLPDECKAVALDALREEGLEVILGQRVVDVTPYEKAVEGDESSRVTLSDGTTLLAGQVISAISRSRPATSYLPELALDREGLVCIDECLRFLPSNPNNARHLAIGDLVAWCGIKRCGGAIAMGGRAADNTFQQMLFEQHGIEPRITPWPEVPPLIALAVGKKAVVYDPVEGTRCSEEQMKIFFGDDLGFKQCYDYLKLGETPAL